MRLDQPEGFRHTPNALSRLRSAERVFVFLRRPFSEVFPQTATSVRNSTSRLRRATSSCARYSRCSSTRPTSGSVRCSKTAPARSRSRHLKSGRGRHVTQTARCSGFAGNLAALVELGGLFTALLTVHLRQHRHVGGLDELGEFRSTSGSTRNPIPRDRRVFLRLRGLAGEISSSTSRATPARRNGFVTHSSSFFDHRRGLRRFFGGFSANVTVLSQTCHIRPLPFGGLLL